MVCINVPLPLFSPSTHTAILLLHPPDAAPGCLPALAVPCLTLPHPAVPSGSAGVPLAKEKK